MELANCCEYQKKIQKKSRLPLPHSARLKVELSGSLERVGFNGPFLGLMLNPMTLSMLERIGDSDVKPFVAFPKVSHCS